MNERWAVNVFWTVNESWTNGERTLNERENGKVERFRDCMYIWSTSVWIMKCYIAEGLNPICDLINFFMEMSICLTRVFFFYQEYKIILLQTWRFHKISFYSDF
jgi:hypothetical protein